MIGKQRGTREHFQSPWGSQILIRAWNVARLCWARAKEDMRQEPTLGAGSSEWTQGPCLRTDEGGESVGEAGHGIEGWP